MISGEFCNSIETNPEHFIRLQNYLFLANYLHEKGNFLCWFHCVLSTTDRNMFCKSWKLMIYSKYKVARQGILRIDKLKQTFPFVPIVQLSTVAMKISHLPMSSKYLRCKLYQCRGASKAPFIIFMELASAHCIQWPWRITKLRLCLSPYRTISQRSQAAQGFLADASNYIENLCSSLIYANVSIFRYLTYPIRNLVLLPGI